MYFHFYDTQEVSHEKKKKKMKQGILENEMPTPRFFTLCNLTCKYTKILCPVIYKVPNLGRSLRTYCKETKYNFILSPTTALSKKKLILGDCEIKLFSSIYIFCLIIYHLYLKLCHFFKDFLTN